MSFSHHLSTFAGLPIVAFPSDPDDAPLPPEAQSGERFAWRLEVNVRWDAKRHLTFEELFAIFLERVDTSRVEAIVIGRTSTEMDGDPVSQTLAAAAYRLPALRAVFLADVTGDQTEVSWIVQQPVTPLLEAFPRLEELWVRGGPGDPNRPLLAPIKHAALRTLVFQSGGLPLATIRAIGECEFPNLEHLEIYIGDPNYGGTAEIEDFQWLLDGSTLPKLRYLGLKDAEYQNEIAAALAHAPVVAKLEVLDLSLGTFDDEGAAALLAGQPLTHLRKLDLWHNFLSEPMKQRLREALPDVEIDLSFPNSVFNADPDDRYIAVSE